MCDMSLGMHGWPQQLQQQQTQQPAAQQWQHAMLPQSALAWNTPMPGERYRKIGWGNPCASARPMILSVAMPSIAPAPEWAMTMSGSLCFFMTSSAISAV